MQRVALALLLAACTGPEIRGHVQAERLHYQWIAPMLRSYVAADERVSEAQKAAYLKGLDWWHVGILEQERRLGIKPPRPSPPIVIRPHKEPTR